MKKNLLRMSFTLLLLCLITSNFNAQGKLIHYWHFNNTTPTSGSGGTHLGTGKMNSDYSRASETQGYLRFVKVPTCAKDTGYWDNLLGDSTNQRTGFGGCCPPFGATLNNSAVRTRNPTDSMMFLWYLPTKNFQNIVIKYASESSSTGSGPGRQKYDYSLDSGLTFITTNLLQLFDSAGVTWGKKTLNLSGISGVNNNNKFMLRIKTGSPNTGTSGNTRYDNITVEGDSLGSAPVGINVRSGNVNGYNLYPNPSTDLITLNTLLNSTKNILVINTIGQTILTLKQEGKDIPIDISELNKGIYFIRVNEQTGENTQNLKFIKE